MASLDAKAHVMEFHRPARKMHLNQCSTQDKQ